MSSGFSVNLAPTVAALEAGQDAITAQLLGVGMTWEDVTGSRAANTVYQNTHGRPIVVLAGGSWNGSDATPFEVSSDGGVTWVPASSLHSGGTSNGGAIVGAGEHYRFVGTSISFWSEYLPDAGAAELPAVTTLTNSQLETLIQAYIDTLNLGGGGGGGLFGTATDVTASRTHSTDYQNSTGGPMLVSLSVLDLAKTARLEISQNQTQWYWDGSFSNYGTRTLIVPNGWFYRLGNWSGNSITLWEEYTA